MPSPLSDDDQELREYHDEQRARGAFYSVYYGRGPRPGERGFIALGVFVMGAWFITGLVLVVSALMDFTTSMSVLGLAGAIMMVAAIVVFHYALREDARARPRWRDGDG